MRAFVKQMMIVIVLLVIVGAAMNMAAGKIINESRGQRNIVAGRITAEIEAAVNESAGNIDDEEIENAVFYSRKSEWEQLYGCRYCPVKADIILFDDGTRSNAAGGKDILVYFIHTDGRLTGIVQYSFTSPDNRSLIIVMDICLGLCVLFVLIYSGWVRRKLLIPFNRLSDYPERLSKGEFTEKLPETDDRFFGKYIWGMNMLSDKLEHDRETIRQLLLGREQFVTSLVHGIKTPAANIKLYSEAIATGLYDPDGNINEKDAELAGKIEKQADEIEHIVDNVMDTGAAVIFDPDPDAQAFYRHRIEDLIKEEYANRLKVGRVPFETVSEGDPLIKSDIGGVFRIIRQIMDNALKYGDGTGIRLEMEKTDEGHFITIVNNGTPLPESEMPFVWRSLWRGSNSSGIKGSGVGLYESRYIARKMGGDIYMRAGENSTAVTLFLPQ